MPLDADAYMTLVVAEVGDVDSFIQQQIDTLWTLYDAQTDDYLHYLYAKRKAIDMLMGLVREQVTRQVDGPLLINLTDKLKNLQVMWGNVNGEIEELVSKSYELAQQEATAGTPVAGQLTTMAPVTPLSGPDANSLAYKGSPYGWRP